MRLAIIAFSVLFSASACAVSPNIGQKDKCYKAYQYHFLNRASASGDVLGIKILLNKGADPNGKDYTNYADCVHPIEFSSPLYLAAYGGHIDSAKLLINSGANPNLVEGEGVTALIAAIKSNNHNMVRLLLQHGAKKKVKGLIVDPLYTAKRIGNQKIINLI